MYNYQMYYPYSYNELARQYPPVDTSTFHHSVLAFQKTAHEATTILNKLAQPSFAYQLMAAAQAGRQHEVDRLIKSIGTQAPVTTHYTPDGVLLTIHAEAQGSQCCTLSMFLRWR